MKFLIAGFGSAGRRHFRNLLAQGQEDILFYRTGRSQLPEDELDGYVVEHDIDAALAHQPDAVIIANPTALHLDVAIPAAKAGCHILLEKPISHSLDRIDELEAAVAASGSRVLVGFQYRFHPLFRMANDLLDSKTLGEVLSLRAVYGEYLPGWHPWEKDFREGYSARADMGGGAVLTLCHPIDYVRWLLGDFTSVSAELKNSGLLGIQVEDQADLVLETEAGALCNIHLDYLQRPKEYRFEVICSEGFISWQGDTDKLRVYHAQDESWAEHPVPEGYDRDRLFVDQTRHFIDVVNGEAEPYCSLHDGIQVLKVALAAHRSSEEGRRVALNK